MNVCFKSVPSEKPEVKRTEAQPRTSVLHSLINSCWRQAVRVASVVSAGANWWAGTVLHYTGRLTDVFVPSFVADCLHIGKGTVYEQRLRARELVTSQLPERFTRDFGNITKTLSTPKEAKSLLKYHRFDSNFTVADTGLRPEGSIIACKTAAETKKLRGIYQDLLGSAGVRGAVQERLFSLMETLRWDRRKGLCLSHKDNTEPVLARELARQACFLGLLGTSVDTDVNRVAVHSEFKQLESGGKRNEYIEELVAWGNEHLGHVMELMNSRRYSQREQGHALFTMIVLSTDITSDALVNLLKQIDEKHLKEIDDEIEHMVADGLTFARAALKSEKIQQLALEGLRFYPQQSRPAKRKAQVDCPTWGVLKGDSLEIDNWALTRDPKVVGACPRKFVPERINVKEFWPGVDYLPFGSGMHQCPAWYYYRLFITAVLANISRNMRG